MIVSRFTVKKLLDGEPVDDPVDVEGRAAALRAMRAPAPPVDALDEKAAPGPGLLDERSLAGRSGLLGGR